MKRCPWSEGSKLYRDYHDNEWGVPVHDDRILFEFLILESMQAGLSWITILKKRKRFNQVFDNFEFNRIVEYSDQKIDNLLQDKGIVRNKLKVLAAVRNAEAFIRVREKFESFDKYIWQFTDGRQKTNRFNKIAEIPTTTAESIAMSKDLKKKGFQFIGPKVCYAFMQAIGMVNDHLTTCDRHYQIEKNITRTQK
ncbi:MAG TPA: DNA-3-methyladenine glycosylase I [Nitrospinota bacterium]|nr:DNA-3-methyladenine glycosylase I [Nitrospinota bacterium]|tara:strand:- start:15817 stop:16401 length:585 start_codon:yes stop_codon:yes gene_type:complete